jgi:L-ascorbate metabolism protein UlaG (beta-lactamase superfamily)
MEITLIGQATLLIKMSGLSIMTDPWWGRFEFLRGVPITLDPEGIDPVDVMLVSHNHVDHWSGPAIELAKRRGSLVIGSRKAARRAMKAGCADVVAMSPGDEHEFRGVTFRAVRADHPFARDAVGFVVRGEKTLYFSGDTRFTPALGDALWSYMLDAALLQVACSRYPLVGKDGMDLDDAARLVEKIKPAAVVPIHYQVRGKTLSANKLHQWKVAAELVVLEPGVPRRI